MPWTHCDAELNDTEASCPVCGTTKAEWTVGFDSTRTFQVARRTLFRIELVDANDEPVGSQPFELKRLSDGDWEPGTLDEDGFAKVPSPREARGLVRFTGLATGSIRRTSPERDDASPSLKSGSEGDAVFELQEILVELGYPLVVDGAFGSETDGAVRWFQGDRALGVDGKVGPNTWAALRAADPPAPPLPPPPVLRRGDRGAKVRKLQQGLKAQGAAVEVDGQFGPATEEALRAFQERKGLDVDGKVGPNTWASVLSEGTPATLACSTGREVLLS